MQHFDAKDKTFVITGGASGLGAQYVEVFLSKGAKAIAVLDIAEKVGKAAAERLNNIYDDKVLFIKCDMSKEEDITSAFDIILTQFKQIDVIINNAGVMNDAPNIWRTACDVNWQGLVSLTLNGIKHMRKDKGGAGGTIVNISSIGAITRTPYVPIYKGSKMAVLHFTQCISMDPFYESTSIRLLTMCFGATDTPLVHNLEGKCYEPGLGKTFAEVVGAASHICQKMDSAVEAVVHMFENGAPGTVWLSVDNKPVKDITPVINRVFQELQSVLSSD